MTDAEKEVTRRHQAEDEVAGRAGSSPLWGHNDLGTIYRAVAVSLAAEVQVLRDALTHAIGWINYAVECDPFYFDETQASTFTASMKEIEAALEKVAKEHHDNIPTD